MTTETLNDSVPTGSVITEQVVRVRLAGSGSTVKITLTGEGDTVASVLRAAAEQLGLPADTIDSLSPVVNGEDARGTDPVNDEDIVTAAPKVSNG
jgi:hypothetical protein